MVNEFFWLVAILMSVFWGFYGIVDENMEEENEDDGNGKTKSNKNDSIRKNDYGKVELIYSIGAFISDFVLSFIGWLALYILHSQYSNVGLVNLNIFLGIVAIVGISGYGSKIPEKMKIGS